MSTHEFVTDAKGHLSLKKKATNAQAPAPVVVESPVEEAPAPVAKKKVRLY